MKFCGNFSIKRASSIFSLSLTSCRLAVCESMAIGRSVASAIIILLSYPCFAKPAKYMSTFFDGAKESSKNIRCSQAMFFDAFGWALEGIIQYIFLHPFLTSLITSLIRGSMFLLIFPRSPQF